jgi:phosphate acetyltransferase
VITPGDRADIILGALQANESLNYPTISNCSNRKYFAGN